MKRRILKPRIIPAIAAIALIFPIWIWYKWIEVFYLYPNKSYAAKQIIFLSYFPPFIKSLQLIIFAVIVFCLSAVLLSAYSLKQRRAFSRIPAFMIIIMGGLMFLVSIFSLM